MRILVVCFCLAFFFACKKENEKSVMSELNGKWELRVTDGGYSYAHKAYAAGNGNTLIFSGMNQYQEMNIIDGKKDSTSGTYSVKRGTTCYSNDVIFIQLGNIPLDNVSIVSVLGDSLYIKANSCVIADAVDRTYVKVN